MVKNSTGSYYQNQAIVCDAEKISQIAIIQELGRLQIPIIAISAQRDAVGFASKYVRQKISCDISSYQEEYITYLKDNLPRGVIFCSNDANAENIAKHKSMLLDQGFKVLISDSCVLEQVIQKDQLFKTAMQCSIKVPKCFGLSSLSQIFDLRSEFEFPFIIKATNLAGGVYRFVNDPGRINKVYDEMNAIINSGTWRHRKAHLMIQEWIPQKNVKLWNFNALARGGEIVSFSMGERKRTNIFPDGSMGSTLLLGETHHNASIFKANQALLRYLKYDGIMETEWSENPDCSDMTYLYDFNPRPSGNIRWVFQSGVSFVEQYYQICLGLPISVSSGMKEGVKYYKIFHHDNDFLKALENPQFSYPQKVSVLKENIMALLTYQRHAIDILDVKDLGPTLRASRDLPVLFLKAIIRLILSIFGGRQ